LTGALAHDFNNVLMIVSGHAQMLQRRLQDARLAPPLASIRTAVAQGENLTRRLLAFSRRQMLSPTVVSLSERIAAARETLAGSLTERIVLEYDLAPELWPVAIDVAELDLALKNIAANARDAMPDGGTLTLSARNVRLDANEAGGVAGDFVALALSDTGGGIAPDALSKVFEPFFTTKPAGMGAGLGLSQVYGFAHRSGGRVTAESRSGEGTTITIYLPRSRTAPSAAIVPSATFSAPGTVLVVEDNPQVADVTSELLEHLGYRTVRAENAVAALQTLARNHEIGLVFSDITMPGMNGIALAHEIVKRHPAMPVLLTTGYSEALQAGQSEFAVLRKPFEIPALERAVRRAMHHAQSGNDSRPSA
jgi:CheY-like chemotaxis protein